MPRPAVLIIAAFPDWNAEPSQPARASLVSVSAQLHQPSQKIYPFPHPIVRFPSNRSALSYQFRICHLYPSPVPSPPQWRNLRHCRVASFSSTPELCSKYIDTVHLPASHFYTKVSDGEKAAQPRQMTPSSRQEERRAIAGYSGSIDCVAAGAGWCGRARASSGAVTT